MADDVASNLAEHQRLLDITIKDQKGSFHA
jgi:hypothetical protein